MDQTINALLKGDKNIVAYYQKTNEKWQELFVAKKDSPVSTWAQWLSDQQIPFFERECGGRHLGEEVMACSGFGVLYNVIVGFDEMEELAVKLVKAFEESRCSIEVKSMARHAATYYHLDQLPQLKEFLP